MNVAVGNLKGNFQKMVWSRLVALATQSGYCFKFVFLNTL